jgi:hypothetical protein
MNRCYSYLAALSVPLLWSGGAAAFRTCDVENSHAYAASTQYVVGEIAFDQMTGLASGTKTIYNYANQDAAGFTECHVTYELSGSYTPGAEMFVLDGRRTNYSAACPSKLVDLEYPTDLTYSLQMTFGANGTSTVSVADSGEFLASGSWEAGMTVYKTSESCTIF